LPVIGVGLIGGSFSAALKEKKLCGHVVGAGRSAAKPEDRAAARRDRFNRRGCPRQPRSEADLVLISTPVAQFERIFRSIGPNSEARRESSPDAGSTKRDVVATARAVLGARIAQFVPAHPIAGAEYSGAAAARSGAVSRAPPGPYPPRREQEPRPWEAIAALWTAIGARVCAHDTRRSTTEIFGDGEATCRTCSPMRW